MQHYSSVISFFLASFSERLPCYWQFLPTYEPSSAKKKTCLYDIQSCFCCKSLHFSFSFLVICLDTCTIKCSHTEAVLLFTETFQITNEHLCFGTATRESKQSWSFFLLNLRQALLHYCSEVIDWRWIVFCE